MKTFFVLFAIVSSAFSAYFDESPGIFVDVESDDDGGDKKVVIETVSLPMRSAVIQGNIVGGVAEVTLTQEFETPTSLPFGKTQGRYQLPLDEKAAVTSFRAEFGDRVIEGVVKEKEKARDEYDEAIEAGVATTLAEQIRPDIFIISFGNMPPNLIVRIVLVYISPLDVVSSNKFRFILPTKIAPRYQPRGSEEEALESLEPLLNDGVKMSMGVISSFDLNITSNTHDIESRKVTNVFSKNLIIIVDVVDINPLERDLVIHLEAPSLPSEPLVFLEESSNGTYAMLMTWVPQQTTQSNFDGVNDRKKEFIFLLDRSGSMQDDKKIEQLRKSMRNILDNLPSDSLFNFIGFGDHFEYLFPEGSKRVSDTSAFNSAKSYINLLMGDMGGTEILAPIKDVLESETIPTYQKIVFLITDGQVSNVDEIIEFVGNNLRSSRIFTLGIGPNVGRNLLNGIARNGNGSSDYVNGDDDEAIVDAVQRQMDTVLNDILINITSVVFDDVITTQVPYQTPRLLYGRYVSMYFLTDIDSDGRVPPGDVTIQIDQNLGKEGLSYYRISSSRFIPTSSDVIHKLGAREMIRDLEEGRSNHLNGNKPSKDEIKKKIADIGVKYQIISSETSFVAIDNKGWISGADTSSSTTDVVPRTIPPVYSPPSFSGVLCNYLDLSFGGGGIQAGGGTVSYPPSPTPRPYAGTPVNVEWNWNIPMGEPTPVPDALPLPIPLENDASPIQITWTWSVTSSDVPTTPNNDTSDVEWIGKSNSPTAASPDNLNDFQPYNNKVDSYDSNSAGINRNKLFSQSIVLLSTLTLVSLIINV